MSRPVVAFVTDSVFPFRQGGKEIRYHALATRLAKVADVHVYTSRSWQGPRAVERGGVTYHAICPDVPMYRDGRRSLVQAAVFGLASTTMLWRRFDALEADQIPYLPLFVLRVVCTLRRKRLCATWHEVWGEAAWRDYLGRVGTLAARVERWALLTPDTLIAASEGTAERVRAVRGARGGRVVVAPNGLDLDLIEAAAPAATTSDVIFVGRLLGHKNADVLLAAVALLRDRGTEVTCRMVGSGPELPALRLRAQKLGIAHQVEFLDAVATPTELYGLLKASRLFVLPSVREGFGIAVLEAIACGLPVITSDHPDNLARHLVEDPAVGQVCPPRPLELADAIDVALTHREELPESARRGAVAGYDWDSVVTIVADALGVVDAPH